MLRVNHYKGTVVPLQPNEPEQKVDLELRELAKSYRHALYLTLILWLPTVWIVDLSCVQRTGVLIIAHGQIVQLRDGSVVATQNEQNRDEWAEGRPVLGTFTLQVPGEERGLFILMTSSRYETPQFQLEEYISTPGGRTTRTTTQKPSEESEYHSLIYDSLVRESHEDVMAAWHGTLPSVRYRWIQILSFVIPLFACIALVINAPGTALRWRRRRWMARGCCWHCGYDLRNLSDLELCPECGSSVK